MTRRDCLKVFSGCRLRKGANFLRNDFSMFRRLVRGGEEGEEKSGIVFVEKDFR